MRYGTGTVASTKVSATRNDRRTAHTDRTDSGNGRQQPDLTVDGTRLKEDRFQRRRASFVGTLYWTPGSKLYKTTAVRSEGNTWGTAAEPTISGILASRKSSIPACCGGVDGTVWLFFTYMSAGDTDTTAVYNLYYSKSSDDGATWSAAVELTSFATPSGGQTAGGSAKLAAEIVLAYDSVRTSLTMDKSNPYWTDENLQGLRHLHFNTATRNCMSPTVTGMLGPKHCLLLRIDVDTWMLDKYWNGNTVPQIPLAFREQHVFEFCGGKTVICAGNGDNAYTQQILWLNDESNTINVISLINDAKYGYTKNVTNLPEGHFGTPKYDDISKTLYFSCNDDYYWHPRINLS